MIILVCGSREWNHRESVRLRLSKLDKTDVVIHGACRGADVMAGEEAKKLGLKVVSYPADWRRYGRSAGPIRNRKMLDEKPGLVIAFHEDISKSSGTLDCINEARRRGIPVELIDGKAK